MSRKLFSANKELFSPYDTLEMALQELWEMESEQDNLEYYTVYEAHNDGVFVKNTKPRFFREVIEEAIFDFNNFEEISLKEHGSEK